MLYLEFVRYLEELRALVTVVGLREGGASDNCLSDTVTD